MNNFANETQELLKAALIGSFILICYLIVYFVLNKLIKSSLAKAIVIGAITPFFFHYSIAYLIHPLAIFLYILEIDPIGLVGGIIIGLLKPLSLTSGILVTLYLVKKR
ncbi:hypothetical protein IQ255_24440 [Pleurocapsales cyanobacterium LEGE 10410]|nr:hypothetical protein [Pleurocapsales cyanobacterium LEGE 10410]